MTTWIKICGLTNAIDAGLAVELGADALGFVFHRESRRRCEPEQARAFLRALPKHVAIVGVWLDEPADAVLRTIEFVGCRRVQTYSPRTAMTLRDRGVDVLPAIFGGAQYDPDKWDEWQEFLRVWPGQVLVDQARSLRGNSVSGAPSSSDRASSPIPPARMILAGGLSPDSVRHELNRFQPCGVDVASGVETGPGRKCPRKLADFIKEVRLWDAMVASGALADSSSPKR